MKVLLVCPEAPHAGGMGRIFWNIAEAGSKYSDWETHILTPFSDSNKEKVKEFNGYRKVDIKGLHCWEPARQKQLIMDAVEYHKEENFDMVYIPVELELFKNLGYVKQLGNVVIGVHSVITQISSFNERKPVTEQLASLRIKKKLKLLIGEFSECHNVHLISDMEEKIWNTILPEHKNYVTIPDMMLELKEFMLPYEERTNDIVFCGRVTSTMKGSEIIQQLMERNPSMNFKIMCTKGTVTAAGRKFGKFNNCKIVSHEEHNDVLKEFSKHKVFCNTASYGAFDLTTTEAASQKCQIVACDCIGSTWHFENIVKPNEYTVEGFEEAINRAFLSRTIPKNKLPKLEQEINEIFNKLYSPKALKLIV